MTSEEIVVLAASSALVRKREVEARLREIKGDLTKLDEREVLKKEDLALIARLQACKEENRQRALAGFSTPLYDALVEYITDEGVLDALEKSAVAKLAERERLGAERAVAKAAKKAAGDFRST